MRINGETGMYVNESYLHIMFVRTNNQAFMLRKIDDEIILQKLFFFSPV